MHVYNSSRGQMGLHLPQKLIVDNFAGGGGASMGLEMGFNRPVDIAINHDAEAISMHITNHPDTQHYCESVWDVDPVKACHGSSIEWAHFSPDCTHHSKARGGKPKKKEIRGLAWIVIKWAILKRPETISLENVEEFQGWGPLDKDGHPIKERAGETYEAFKAMLTTGIRADHPAVAELQEFMPVGFDIQPAINGLGYSVDSRELRACDYGAPTIRKRYFLLAKSGGGEINWPCPTHGKPDSEGVLAGKLLPYRTAAECIDWSIPCPSIFGRKKPLAEATLQRIARGLKRFVLDAKEPFITPHGDAALISKHKFMSEGHALNEPLHTITAGGHSARPAGAPHSLALTTAYIQPYYGDKSPIARGRSPDDQLATITTNNRFALVSAFLAKHYGGNYTGAGVGMDEPCGTVTTVDHHALVTSHLVKLRNNCTGSPVTDPMHTITVGGGHMGEVRAFLLKYYGNDVHGQSLAEPLHTIPTRDRFGLVTIHGTQYQIIDIGMRMLEPHELYVAQGFPAGYIHDRTKDGKPLTKSAQVRMVGNSVPPVLLAALVQANKEKENKNRKVA